MLSLIPSKYYYEDEESENQWNKRKQTKEQFKRNKKLKFDPQSNKNLSVKQVLQKNAVTAKPAVIPGSKKNKVDTDVSVSVNKEDKSSDEGQQSDDSDLNNENDIELVDEPLIKSDDEQITLIYDDAGNEIELDVKEEKLKIQRQKENEQQKKNLTNLKKEPTPEEKLKKQEKLSKLKSKLQEKIDLMKSKRKAIGSNVPGAPKSREQIIEERRRKNELREKNKKELSKEDDEDEDESDINEDDDELDEQRVDDDQEESGVLFQNIIFNDGDRTTSDLTRLRKMKKKKGPANRDIKAHLKIAQQKKAKLGNLDDESKQQFEEKDRWNRLLLQAEGVKVKDDEKMLKKALKNKERQKRKSENQWYERNNNVKKNIQERLKRREENLQIRKENKGVKRKNQKKQLRKFSGPRAKKSKKTAGF